MWRRPRAEFGHGPGDLVARFSGDEITVMLDGPSRIRDVVHVARVQPALADPEAVRDADPVATRETWAVGPTQYRQ